MRPLIAGVVVILWVGMVVGSLVGGLPAIGGLSPWATLLVAVGSVALLLFDTNELTDYALFGVALGGAVASRVNVAPLAGIIVIAALIRVLPVLSPGLSNLFRRRLLAYAMLGVITAALMSFVVFRLLQPHAFTGPGLLGLKFNQGWREDINQAAYLTSGDWDAPPNHQWAGRTPYFFPWRNIVLWGFGIPFGLIAWAAWAWGGYSILRGRRCGRGTPSFLCGFWCVWLAGWALGHDHALFPADLPGAGGARRVGAGGVGRRGVGAERERSAISDQRSAVSQPHPQAPLHSVERGSRKSLSACGKGFRQG